MSRFNKSFTSPPLDSAPIVCYSLAMDNNTSSPAPVDDGNTLVGLYYS